MGSNESDRDPEIRELSREIHDLTGQIKALVTEINKTSVMLLVRTEDSNGEGRYHGND